MTKTTALTQPISHCNNTKMGGANQPTRRVNPHAKSRPPVAHNEENIMGRQSQQRIRNQVKRKFKLASNNSNKRRKGGQQTLFGGAAFEAEKDCIVCHARASQRINSACRVPNRSHHELCIRNTKTKGKGATTKEQQLTLEDNKRHKALTQPTAQAEKGSARRLPADGGAACFAPRVPRTIETMTPAVTATRGKATTDGDSPISIDFCKAVSNMVADAACAEKNKAKMAPLAMMAFAKVAEDKTITKYKTHDYFDGITMEVPPCLEEEEFDNPQHHSMVGQKLLCVDWERSHALQVPCPDGSCKGALENDRSNCSKNKTSFPAFDLQGPPTWCVVMSMVCSCCCRRLNANEGEVLVNLPDHIAEVHPVEPQCACAILIRICQEKQPTCSQPSC